MYDMEIVFVCGAHSRIPLAFLHKLKAINPTHVGRRSWCFTVRVVGQKSLRTENSSLYLSASLKQLQASTYYVTHNQLKKCRQPVL